MGKPSSTSKAIDDANLGAACDPQIQSSYLLVNAQADARRDLVPNGGLAAAPRASLHYDHHERKAGDQHRPPTISPVDAAGGRLEEVGRVSDAAL